jgi:hypothetical protein
MMGFQTCDIHGIRYQDYGECAQCMTERLQEEAMRRQEELLREQTELMRRAAAQRQPTDATADGTKAITRENLSRDLLKSALEDATFNVSLDKDGDLVVSEQIRCFVLPNKERGTIRLMTGFVFKDEVPNVARIEAANQINVKFLMVRASVSGDVLYFDHDMFLNDGFSRRALALTVKRFCAIPGAAVAECAGALVQ